MEKSLGFPRDKPCPGTEPHLGCSEQLTPPSLARGWKNRASLHGSAPPLHPRPPSPERFSCKRRLQLREPRWPGQGWGGSYSHITSAGRCRRLDVTVSPCLTHTPAGRMKIQGWGGWKRFQEEEEGGRLKGEGGEGDQARGSGTGTAGLRVPRRRDGDGERSCLCPVLPSSTGASTEVGSSPQILGGLCRLRWVSLDAGQGCGTGAASLGPGHPGEVGARPVPLCLIR